MNRGVCSSIHLTSPGRTSEIKNEMKKIGYFSNKYPEVFKKYEKYLGKS